MLRRHRRKFVLATLGISVLMVSACSDGGERTSTTATTATTEAPTTTVKPLKKLDVAVVTPSAENDLAFTQSMVDALKLVATERGADGMSLQVTPQMFDVEKARAEVERYAAEGVDVIFAHGSQYGDIVKETATAYPEITFAWGTASDTFGLPNVYAYTVAADQGGYVLGVLAAELTESGSIGVVGPVEVGDAKLYTDGFVKGVTETKPEVKTGVTYIGSFSDVVKAGEAAKEFTAGGADVLTGSSQAMSGAVPVAVSAGAAWFGNQASYTALAPDAVVASQVYHFEDTVRQVLQNTERGVAGGQTFTLTLANDGLVIEYNPDYELPGSAREKADAAEARIEADSPEAAS
ncbi:MAG: BMP family ABC transporter substrate-binding protein [Acidimicrobiia bacterium]